MRHVTCSLSGRRRCAWTWLLQRNVIHDTIKLLTGDAGSGTLRLDHCGFGSRDQLCSQDTFWFHFSVFVDPLHEHKGITTSSPMPGEAALPGESDCSPRKALPGKCRAEILYAIHDTSKPLGGDAPLPSLQELAIHITFSVLFSSLSVSTPGRTTAAALGPGCCAGDTRMSLLEVCVVGTSFQDTRHNLAHFLVSPWCVSSRCQCCCFYLDTLEQFLGPLVRFPTKNFTYSVSSQQVHSTLDGSMFIVGCPSREVHFACRCAVICTVTASASFELSVSFELRESRFCSGERLFISLRRRNHLGT